MVPAATSGHYRLFRCANPETAVGGFAHRFPLAARFQGTLREFVIFVDRRLTHPRVFPIARDRQILTRSFSNDV
jgi:hypothetical protein